MLIIQTLTIAKIRIILFECLNLNLKFKKIKENNKINVKIAGYMLNAAIKSPLIIKAKERCIPQPGQSIPKSCLLRQGNM